MLFRSIEIVRLGQGVDRNKSFHPDAIARTLDAVNEFALEIRRRGVSKVRFCATSATRDATNRSIFVEGVKKILGLEPEVISGDEEARLSFLGATRELHGTDSPFLVVDIGGGSTEFVSGNQKVEAAKSVNIGCVRLSERHLTSQPPSKDQVEKAIIDIDRAISEAAISVPLKARTLVAVAGTATTVAAAALNLDAYDRYSIHLSRIPATEVHEVSSRFLRMNRDEIASLGYMHPEIGRAHV